MQTVVDLETMMMKYYNLNRDSYSYTAVSTILSLHAVFASLSTTVCTRWNIDCTCIGYYCRKLKNYILLLESNFTVYGTRWIQDQKMCFICYLSILVMGLRPTYPYYMQNGLLIMSGEWGNASAGQPIVTGTGCTLCWRLWMSSLELWGGGPISPALEQV